MDLDYDGLMIETHCNPNQALTDKKQQLTPDELFELTDHITTDPVKILLNEDNITLDGISQYFINVQKDNWKYDRNKGRLKIFYVILLFR